MSSAGAYKRRQAILALLHLLEHEKRARVAHLAAVELAQLTAQPEPTYEPIVTQDELNTILAHLLRLGATVGE